MKKKAAVILTLAIALALSPATATLTMNDAQAATTSTYKKNVKARKLYLKKVRAYSRKYAPVEYKIVDTTGDGISECLMTYHDPDQGSAWNFRIYTYKKGKIKCILSSAQYGMSKLTIYRRSRSFIMYCSGHGGESYHYFIMKKGRYSEAASRSRMSVSGGNYENGPWYYYGGLGQISSSDFKQLVKNVKKGSRKTVKIESFNTMVMPIR